MLKISVSLSLCGEILVAPPEHAPKLKGSPSPACVSLLGQDLLNHRDAEAQRGKKIKNLCVSVPLCGEILAALLKVAPKLKGSPFALAA